MNKKVWFIVAVSLSAKASLTSAEHEGELAQQEFQGHSGSVDGLMANTEGATEEEREQIKKKKIDGIDKVIVNCVMGDGNCEYSSEEGEKVAGGVYKQEDIKKAFPLR